MSRASLIISVFVLGLPSAAFAGPMPILPTLPPLPMHYEVVADQPVQTNNANVDYDASSASGVYGGIMSGYSAGPEDGLGLAIMVGNTIAAADLLLGLEVMAFVATAGDISIESGVRVGVPLSDTVNAFANAGLGHSFDTDTFVSWGLSLEADMGSSWIARADYRYNQDLSGDAGTHKVLAGLLHVF